MNPSDFDVPQALLDRLDDELRGAGHDQLTPTVLEQHPRTLGSTDWTVMGGGCSAYVVTLPYDGQDLLIVWTDSSGMDLPEPDDYLIGIYEGEISEDPLLLIEQE